MTNTSQTPDDNPAPKTGPLAGLRVLDLSRFVAGPYCAMMLGDMGADVVKIERKGKGEDSRGHPPIIDGVSLYAAVFNRNKRSVAVDFRDPADQEIIRKLAAEADIIVENFRPGIMERMGCGWDTLSAANEKLIMTRITGFGRDGPYAGRPCFDSIAQAMGGLMQITGQKDGPPTKTGTVICDYLTGMYAALGTLAAVNARHVSGKGQLVDVALLDAAVSLLMTAIPEQMLLGQGMTRMGNSERYNSPTACYESASGDWVFISGSPQGFFFRFAEAIGHPELASDPRFAQPPGRLANSAYLEGVVAGWARQQTTAEILAAMEAADIPCAKVATIEDVVSNPQLRHSGQIIDVPDDALGTIPMQGVTMNLSATPLTVRRGLAAVGQHNDEVLADWLGEARPGHTEVGASHA